MRPGSAAWWLTKVRQTKRHLLARVAPRERDAVAAWLSPAQLALFDGMHIADRRHGLDVVAALRALGETDREVLLAGLLHDAGKGDTGMVPRILHALGQARISWPAVALGWWPGVRASLVRLRDHAETSAGLAESVGCSARTVDLIRWQDSPHDPEAGERLRLADEAN
ncbi:MAG TPA: hypothetical protein VL749_12645 [Patescibacteria group bacterium]|nr:hypothetical protein [Patescibacteria group bacterium]